jgi:PAS domain S-box-containing protein
MRLEGIGCSVLVADALDASEARVLCDAAPPYKIKAANAMFERMTGFTQASLLGRTMNAIQGEDTHRAAVSFIRSSLRDGKAHTVELFNYTKSGVRFFNRLTIMPCLSTSDEVTHFVGVLRNIWDENDDYDAAMVELPQCSYVLPNFKVEDYDSVFLTQKELKETMILQGDEAMIVDVDDSSMSCSTSSRASSSSQFSAGSSSSHDSSSSAGSASPRWVDESKLSTQVTAATRLEPQMQSWAACQQTSDHLALSQDTRHSTQLFPEPVAEVKKEPIRLRICTTFSDTYYRYAHPFLPLLFCFLCLATYLPRWLLPLQSTHGWEKDGTVLPTLRSIRAYWKSILREQCDRVHG